MGNALQIQCRSITKRINWFHKISENDIEVGKEIYNDSSVLEAFPERVMKGSWEILGERMLHHVTSQLFGKTIPKKL